MSTPVPSNPVLSAPPRPGTIGPEILIVLGPPEMPEFRKAFDDFQRACEADYSAAVGGHHWAEFERGILGKLLAGEDGRTAAIDEILSDGAGREVRLKDHAIGFGLWRNVWTVVLSFPLRGIELAGDRAILRTREFRNRIAAFFGYVTFREWTIAALMDVPSDGRAC